MPMANWIAQSERKPKEYVKGLATTRPDGVASYGICNLGHNGAGSSVASVTHEKRELEPVQTKMENPCVNSGSPKVKGNDNGRVDQ
jgi:hypothetical protein